MQQVSYLRRCPCLNRKAYKQATQVYRQSLSRAARRARAFAQDGAKEIALAPSKPQTAFGEMLQYYLKVEPQLFRSAVENQLEMLKQQKEAQDREAESKPEPSNRMELALYRRMEEVKASEIRATLEDLMYITILEKFVQLKLDMLPKLDGFVDVEPVNLKALTEGIHSKEALELVKDHLLQVMGAAMAGAYSNAILKMSKFQMAQVYAASVMFGYFVRKVDKRFQLEKALGTAPMTREDAVARLERAFRTVDDLESESNPDWVPVTGPVIDLDSPMPSGTSQSQSSASDSSSNAGSPMASLRNDRSKSPLHKYIQSFDQATMIEMARIISQEGANLVERQTSALLGDMKRLTQEIQEAIGADQVRSMEEVYQRMADAVAHDKVETVSMTVATQRRAVLEAVAFGAFLRDVESWVQDEYQLLTPLPTPQLPPGMEDATNF